MLLSDFNHRRHLINKEYPQVANLAHISDWVRSQKRIEEVRSRNGVLDIRASSSGREKRIYGDEIAWNVYSDWFQEKTGRALPLLDFSRETVLRVPDVEAVSDSKVMEVIDAESKVMEVEAEPESYPILHRLLNQCQVDQRPRDGYVNLTQLCKAAGKQFGHYHENQRSQDFLLELATAIGIPMTNLLEIRQAGNASEQGTWGHPRVAVHCAQWCSPKFEVTVTEWVLEVMMGKIQQPQQTTVQLPNIDKTVESVRKAFDLLEMLGGADDRDRVALKDLARNAIHQDKLLPVGRIEWPISDRIRYLGLGTASELQLQLIGKRAAALYRQRYGEDPAKREQFVGGTTRMVNCYTEVDCDILDTAIGAVINPAVAY